MFWQIILEVYLTNCLVIKRIKLVVKSTLAAETLPLEDAAERCFWLPNVFDEILCNKGQTANIKCYTRILWHLLQEKIKIGSSKLYTNKVSHRNCIFYHNLK